MVKNIPARYIYTYMHRIIHVTKPSFVIENFLKPFSRTGQEGLTCNFVPHPRVALVRDIVIILASYWHRGKLSFGHGIDFAYHAFDSIDVCTHLSSHSAVLHSSSTTPLSPSIRGSRTFLFPWKSLVDYNRVYLLAAPWIRKATTTPRLPIMMI